MKLNARQSETLRDIRYLEMGGHGRVIDTDEAQDLCLGIHPLRRVQIPGESQVSSKKTWNEGI